MEKYRVGIVGATGMVGQRFISLLKDHPWFEVNCVAASARSAGKTYREAVGERWAFAWEIPEKVAGMTVVAAADIDSACRGIEDVPMVVPEINADHLAVIEAQKKRLGTKNGFIAVKPNCSIQAYTPALAAWKEFEPREVIVSTYQAISGAGKTFNDWPEMVGNIIPFISGEEEKSEKEPLKVFGRVDEEKGEIVPFDGALKITSQCIRVPVLNGHTATVFINFGKNPTKEELIDRLVNYTSKASELGLPHAPKQFIQYLTDDDRPQVKKDVDYEGGMGVSIGRLREDSIFDWKFVGLAHNTLRGAAGGALESAEMLKALGYITKK